MGKCGCKPCRHTLPTSSVKCKPFTICVGNKSLTWDGKCASVQDREYKIPDGTYTSITFADGCIVEVGEAPLPQYTPLQCCDGVADNTSDGSSLETAVNAGNLAHIQNGVLSVVPVWDTNGNIGVKGLGTADKPWKPSIRLSKKQGNVLVEKPDGLFANLFFRTTGTVVVSGKGTEADPYKLDVQGAEAKLPKLNKIEIEGNGFTIDEFGRWKVDEDLNVVTNLKFDHPAFKVIDQGMATLVTVNAPLLQNGVALQTGDGLSGAGTTESPIKVELSEDLLVNLLTAIESNEALKQRLRAIIGV